MFEPSARMYAGDQQLIPLCRSQHGKVSPYNIGKFQLLLGWAMEQCTYSQIFSPTLWLILPSVVVPPT